MGNIDSNVQHEIPMPNKPIPMPNNETMGLARRKIWYNKTKRLKNPEAKFKLLHYDMNTSIEQKRPNKDQGEFVAQKGYIFSLQGKFRIGQDIYYRGYNLENIKNPKLDYNVHRLHLLNKHKGYYKQQKETILIEEGGKITLRKDIIMIKEIDNKECVIPKGTKLEFI